MKFKNLLNEISNEPWNRIVSIKNLKLYLDSWKKENQDLNKNSIKEKI